MMKLSECKIGEIVQEKSNNIFGSNIGHVVGLTYNIHIESLAGMCLEEKNDRVIPLIRFPDGERGVHQSNLEKYKD